MKITDIFSTLGDLRLYADGLQADTTLQQLTPSIRTTAMEMEKIITKATFEAIAAGGEYTVPLKEGETGEPKKINVDEATELLKTALASGALYRYQIFASAKRNGSDAALYKYQHEEIKDSYIEGYWKAMDALLDWLDSHADIGGYGSTIDYKDRQTLPIKNADEFERYFGIGRSSFFFSKILYIIRDTWKGIYSRIRNHEDDTAVMEAAKKALCYIVIAKVVKRFDLTEFPRSIRFDYNHEYSKGSSTASRDALSADLMAEANATMAEMGQLLRRGSEDSPLANTNLESDKFFFSI